MKLCCYHYDWEPYTTQFYYIFEFGFGIFTKLPYYTIAAVENVLSQSGSSVLAKNRIFEKKSTNLSMFNWYQKNCLKNQLSGAILYAY